MAILSLVLIGFYSTNNIALADEDDTTSASGYDGEYDDDGDNDDDGEVEVIADDGSVEIVIDADNDSDTETFTVRKDGRYEESEGTELFRIGEDGGARFQSGEEDEDGLIVVANGDSKFMVLASGASGMFPNGMAFDFSPLISWGPGPIRFGPRDGPNSFEGFMERMIIDGNGNVGIGTGMAGPTEKLEVVGNVKANNVMVPSDARFKKDITPLRGALDKVNNLQGVNYNWRTDEYKEKNFSDKRNIGIIAQELEKVVPEVVHTGSDGYKSVEYSKLVPLLIEAIKEQQEEIKQLKETVSTLVARQNDLETMFLAVSTTLPKDKLVKLNRFNSDEVQKVVQ